MTDIFKVSCPIASDVIQDARKRMNGLNNGAKAVDQLAISFRWSLKRHSSVLEQPQDVVRGVARPESVGGMMREIYPGMLGVVVQCGIKDRQRGCGGWSLKTGASEWG